MNYEQAFRVIIKKNVDMFRLRYAIMINDLYFYNHAYENKDLHLTEQDFELLKEAICLIK